MPVSDRVRIVDRASRCVRNILRWRGSNVAVCVAISSEVRQFVRFRWSSETNSHVEVQRFDPSEPRIITFALYR